MTADLSLRYEVVTRSPSGKERAHPYVSDEPIVPGVVLRLDGRFWLVESVEPAGEELAGRAIAKPGRYRLHLRHPDGREELGAFRRFRPGSPRLGHSFTTLEDSSPISWEIVDEQLARDDQGEPFLDLIAERDYGEAEGDLPDHELEHALDAQLDEGLPPQAEAAIAQAAEQGLNIELGALEPGEAPDWDEALRYIEALILEEIEDDLIERCGVDPDHDPRETWLDTIKERLRTDLQCFRDDVDGDHDEIEEWEFRGGRIFATVGTYEDEFDPNSGHGWMCRLIDSGVLGIAGFERVRKYELDPEA
jgi:hypothetical protein